MSIQEHHEEVSSPNPRQEDPTSGAACDFHVVGVGASAGGLEALESFFAAMPTDLGVSFVVVQHLSPDFKSHMQQLLARHTEMAVFRVENGMEIRPNSIYLIPPNKEMIISERKLFLTDRDPNKTLSHPIDQFFRSIANDVGRYAVGVILSGTGSDGSRGVRDIHEAGGLVLCQDEQTASFDGMPLNAQQSGAVDLVLPPDAMAVALARYVSESLSPDKLAEQEIIPTALEGIEKVFSLLRQRFGIDFSNYKESTITRRVQRRMSLHQVSAFDDYVDQLEEDVDELDALYRDLLIGVTRFFRDEQMFRRLEEEVIPDILERTDPEELIRVWAAGCATGEEAYSLAILLHEALVKNKRPIHVKIFATDVHRSSLEFAGKGAYPASAMEEMTEARRKRYFSKQGEHWQVVPELRKMIVFAPHNLVQDAPFTQIDLICCRNLLIYFQPSAQKKALSFFHFSLKAGAALVLGPSESTGDLAEEFSVVDKRWRIFRKRRDIRLPADMRIDFSGGSTRLPRAPLAKHSQRTRTLDSQLLQTYDQLLDLKMPSSFLIDESGELIHTFGGAERLLLPRGGRTSTKILDLVDPALKTTLSAAIQHALRESHEVRYTGLVRETPDGDSENFRLRVYPVADPKTSIVNLLIEFEVVEEGKLGLVSSTSVKEDATQDREVDVAKLTEDRVLSLESELRTTQENLQEVVEELETANEELQATNEELVASNEELQSTNEELQSVNEELHTVNAEHQRKIEELTEVTEDLDNLLVSTDVGVIFLDDHLCVRRFTPNIANHFNLLPQDIGRRIDTFSSKLKDENLYEELKQVRDQQTLIERELTDMDGRFFLLRILPYHSPNTTQQGVLLTLVNIENIKRAERRNRDSERHYRTLLDSTAEGVIGLDREGNCTFVNRAAVELLGCSDVREILGGSVCPYIHEDQAEGEVQCDVCDSLSTGEAIHCDTASFRRQDGSTLPVEYWSYPIHAAGEVDGAVITFFDNSQRRQADIDLREARSTAEAANSAKSQFLASMSHELRTPMAAILGYADILLAEIEEEDWRKRLTTIRSNGSYLMDLLNDILDLEKIEAGKLSIHPEKIDILELLSDVVTLMRVRCDVKNLPLHLSMETEIPRYGSTDPRRLRQILVNLVGNAIKFTESGSIRMRVSRVDDSTSTETTLLVEIADTGIGIGEEDLSRIFEPFTQVDHEEQRQIGGTGLGLSISRLLARELGGDILATSQPGEGSVFRLALPIAEPSEEKVSQGEQLEIEQPNLSASRTQAKDSLSGRRILVADDRREIRHVAEYFLKKAGAEVVSAQDGNEVLDLIAAEAEADRTFDLVLMDMQMPHTDGYTATRTLKNAGFSPPIIALTAAAMKGERERCLEAGCSDYMTKPVDGEQLVSACLANLPAAHT